MSNVKYQMPNVNKVKLLLERTSGVPLVIFIFFHNAFSLHCLRNWSHFSNKSVNVRSEFSIWSKSLSETNLSFFMANEILVFRNMRHTTGTRPERWDRLTIRFWKNDTCCEPPNPGVVEYNIVAASSHISGTKSQVNPGYSEKIVNISYVLASYLGMWWISELRTSGLPTTTPR